MTHLVETVLASGMEVVGGTRIALIHKMSVKRPVEKRVRFLLKIACQSDISVKIKAYFNIICFLTAPVKEGIIAAVKT